MRYLIKLSTIAIFLSVSTQGCVLLLPFIDMDKSAELSSGGVSTCPYKRNAETGIAVGDVSAQSLSFTPRTLDNTSQLIESLSNGTEVARTHAATDLGMSRENGTRVIEALARATQVDRSKWVRRAAVKSLEKVGGRNAIPHLRQAAKDRNKWVAHSAKKALQRLQWRRARFR